MTPPSAQPASPSAAPLVAFAAAAHAAGAPAGVVGDYAALHRWSVGHPERFWPLVWAHAGVIAADLGGGRQWDAVLTGGDRMAPPDAQLGPRWFAGARLNFAENLLHRSDDALAIVSRDETGRRRAVSWRELSRLVAAAAAALRHDGVGPGDRVVGYLPNIAETIIAMLAAASLGAVWSSCSPDFGVQGVLDRFGQVAPTVLVTVDGYRYAGKSIPLGGRIDAIAAALPTLRRVVVVPWLGEGGSTVGATAWGDWLASHLDAPLTFTRLPFDHPLYVMYSSGTTGLPKAMVHGAGGTLLQHLKEHRLHVGLQPDDRFFYFTTCGWMMWNWLVTGLASGATLVLYDGAPLAPPTVLWDLAVAEGVTVFGTSAKYLAMLEKEGARPRETHAAHRVRTILSTGSPLAATSFDYTWRDVAPDAHLASISGGTDIISCFLLGVPTLPVHRGELQAPGLGMAVDVWRADGTPADVGEPGELVCTRPFPSMPVAFWDDADGAKYRAAYFTRFPGTWAHGDWVERTPRGGFVIHGRSDATLNPGGVRIGTAEIYRQVETLPEVLESVAVAQAWGDDVRVVLFVRLREGLVLDDALRQRLRDAIRTGASPHHVPRKILQVRDIPRTISGKITELAVREVIHGRPVTNTEALANPAALEEFRGRAELAQ
ncbi:MAG: acetoacetate--CoA ligase [Gemmatimonadales bacterium]|nr:acetoacetate--CoA ligase [Gemmatimonadales bacterium]